MHGLLLACLLLGMGRLLPCLGQPVALPLDRYHVRVFTPADGLPVGNVENIVQIANGPLYIVTGRGLAAFDGYRFRPVPLPGLETQVIESSHADRSGRLWILTKDNHLGYLKRRRFHRMPRMDVLGTTIKNRFFETPEGTLWMSSPRGLIRINPRAADPYTRFTTAEGLPSNAVVRLFGGSEGRVLVHTRGGMAVGFLDPTHPAGIRFRPFAPPSLPPYQARRYNVWGHGRTVWVGFADHVRRYRMPARADAPIDVPPFVRYDGSDRTPSLHIDSLGLRTGRATHLPDKFSTHVRLPNGESVCRSQPCLLLPTEQGMWTSILHRDPVFRVHAGRTERIPLSDHLAYAEINVLGVDHEGSLWVGTDRGIVQLAPRDLTAMTQRSGLAETFTVPVLQTRDGALWVGTWGGGVHRFDDRGPPRRFTRADLLPSDKVRALYEAKDGTLWVGTQRGAVGLKNETIVARIDGIGEARAFAETDDGLLWVGTNSRLLARHPDGSITEPDPAFWTAKQIWALHAAMDGSLWIGSENGLYQLVGDRLHTFGRTEGLHSPFVVAIHQEPDGTLWFSTYADGLHRYRDGRFAAITVREGLHHNGVWRMLWDDHGGIWMSSDQGIFRVDHDRLHAVADAVAQDRRPAEPLAPLVFTESEGMPSRECNRASPGGWRLHDGRFVFNNLQGLVLIDPERALTSPPPPRTLLHEIVADGILQTRVGESEGRLVLPSGTRHLRFDFAALSFMAPQQNRYRYQLDGYDATWIQGGTRPTASYTNLPPGTYTLRVQSASGMSPWGAITTVAFTLRPRIWQTWWFRLLALGLVGGGLVAAYRLRVRHLLDMERLRLRLASDLHDDVGSNISSIALISEMLNRQLQSDGRDRRHVQRIHEAADDTVRALRDIIWLVDPKHDTVTDLVRKMRRVAPALLNGTPYTFEGPPAQEAQRLDLDFIRNIFLVYKEALHNIAKHAEAQHVWIRVTLQHGRLTLQVQDNGAGFDPERVAHGHGLANLRRRADAIGGKIEVESTPGAGTRITLTAKMA